MDYGSWYFFIKVASTISIRRNRFRMWGDANEGEGEVTRHYANDRRDPVGAFRRTANGKWSFVSDGGGKVPVRRRSARVN